MTSATEFCRQCVPELIEAARRGAPPGPELSAHFAACDACAERYAAQSELTFALRAIAAEARRVEREERPLAHARRLQLMRDFASRNRRSYSLAWSLAAAALLLAVGVGHELGVRSGRSAHAGRAARGIVRQVSDQTSADASAISSEEFIAVPFAPPLATGERITVLHANLYPEELASMGIDVDPASSDLPADVVVGQDGIPRAVRITANADF